MVPTRIIRNSLLVLPLLFASIAPPAVHAITPQESAISSRAEMQSDDFADRGFSTGFELFYAGPEWFLNALSNPRSRNPFVRSFMYDSAGDRLGAENGYVGTLRDVFDVGLFNNIATFGGSGSSKTSTSTVAAAGTDPLWTGANSSSWTDPNNWSPVGAPTTTSDVTFSGTPPNMPDQPAGTTTIHTISFLADATTFTGLNTSGEVFALTSAITFTAFSQASPNLQTINQLDIYFNTTTASQIATMDLSGTGGLTLSQGLRWGLGASTQQFIIQGPGSLIVNGTFRGDLSTTGATGGTARRIFLNGDATSGQSVTLNPTSGSTWTAIAGITLGGRVTLNIGNAAAIDAGDIVFASGANNSSLLITGVTSGSTFSRDIGFTGGSITGGTQTIGVNGVSATFSGNISTAGTNNTVALSATAGTTATFNTGVISGARPITITGGGTVTLAGANTYSGGTTISAGNALNINNSGTSSTNSAIGTGTFTISGGTIDNTTAGTITLATNNTQLWNGDFVFTGTRSLDLGSGGVTMNATRQVTVSANNLTVGGVVSGNTFGITKEGAGNLTLNGLNSYSGATTINNGTITANTLANGGSNSSIGSSSNIASNLVINGGVLQYDGTAASSTNRLFTIGTGGAQLWNNSSLSSSTVNFTNTGAITVSGTTDRNADVARTEYGQ